MQERRTVLKRLQKRIYELSQTNNENEDASDDDDNPTDEEMAEFLNKYAPARQEIMGGIETQGSSAPISQAGKAQAAAAAAMITSTLRSRKGAQPAPVDTAASSSASTSQPPTNPSILPFAPKPARDPATGANSTALLEHHDSEQESLTESLLTLTAALKASANAFHDDLTASNPLVDRAVAALDKSVGGMEAAGKRMGMLQKMTEGRSWFARLSLYAWIALAWVAIILVMGLMPKLRIRAW